VRQEVSAARRPHGSVAVDRQAVSAVPFRQSVDPVLGRCRIYPQDVAPGRGIDDSIVIEMHVVGVVAGNSILDELHLGQRLFVELGPLILQDRPLFRVGTEIRGEVIHQDRIVLLAEPFRAHDRRPRGEPCPPEQTALVRSFQHQAGHRFPTLARQRSRRREVHSVANHARALEDVAARPRRIDLLVRLDDDPVLVCFAPGVVQRGRHDLQLDVGLGVPVRGHGDRHRGLERKAVLAGRIPVRNFDVVRARKQVDGTKRAVNREDSVSDVLLFIPQVHRHHQRLRHAANRAGNFSVARQNCRGAGRRPAEQSSGSDECSDRSITLLHRYLYPYIRSCS
jgi:hypothetical protein